MLTFSCAYLDGQDPPVVAFPTMAAGQDRQCAFSVGRVPPGLTVTEVVIEGRIAGVVVFSKIITSTSDAALVGRLIDFGASSVASGTLRLTHTETNSWTSSATLAVSAWAVLSDGTQLPIGSAIALVGDRTIPLAIGSTIATLTVTAA